MSKHLWLLALLFMTQPALGALPLPSPVAKPSSVSEAEGQATDPYETLNRQTYALNTWLTANIVDPAADWFYWLVPAPVQEAGYNMYNNLIEPKVAFKHLVAGNLNGALVSGGRVVINTTVGVGGIWDAASWLGYERVEVTFSDAICSAGIAPGDFVVLPLIGPTTISPLVIEIGVSAAESYLSAPADPTLAASRFLLNLGATAAAMRHDYSAAPSQSKDSYQIWREEYLQGINKGCSNVELASI